MSFSFLLNYAFYFFVSISSFALLIFIFDSLRWPKLIDVVVVNFGVFLLVLFFTDEKLDRWLNLRAVNFLGWCNYCNNGFEFLFLTITLIDMLIIFFPLLIMFFVGGFNYVFLDYVFVNCVIYFIAAFVYWDCV